jgi:NDP-sugar pyrophosphorylase family protein
VSATPAPGPAALVLAAGLGTRFYPLTCTRAKAAAPLAGVPLIERLLRGLAARRVTRIVVNLHHRADTIARIVGDGTALGVSVRYSWEQEVLGSGGGPRRALPLLESDPFLILNGDTLTDLDLDALVAEHHRTGALVTLAVVPHPVPGRYGGVLVEQDGSVSGFAPPGDRRPSWHFVGVQVAAKAVFAPLPDGKPLETVSGIYRDLIRARPGSVRAWRTEGTFIDIGTPGDYLRASLALAAAEGRPEVQLGAECRVAPTARLEQTILWDRVVVGAGARLVDTVVADGVVVPAGASFERVALAPRHVCPVRPPARAAGDLVVADLGERQ